MLRSIVCSIRRSERGATAIEYALIGALIGVGLVAALVSTKGGLNGIFGTASSQMGAASSSASTSATSSGPSAWASRTLAGTPNKQTITYVSPPMNYWTYTYTDGSEVVFYENSGGAGLNSVSYFDSAAHTRSQIYIDATGTTSFNITQYAADNTSRVQTDYSNTGGKEFGGNPPAALNQGVQKYVNNQLAESSTLSAPTAQFQAQAADAFSSYGYYRGLSK